MPRLAPGRSLGTPKILSAGATLHVGPIRLQVENWECRALKLSAWCQKCVPIFLECVNGVSVCLATRKHLLSQERMSLPLKEKQ